jgi:hypothetical protein
MLVACCNKLAKEMHGVCNIVPLLLVYVVYWKEICKCICVDHPIVLQVRSSETQISADAVC